MGTCGPYTAPATIQTYFSLIDSRCDTELTNGEKTDKFIIMWYVIRKGNHFYNMIFACIN